ncbi:hypothetical protein JW911_04055 [Candidatus Peregrinibacteria bacterium]|nr:hypothetical protein [Candidatus Peregrinibacteria bacterium]
MLKMSQNFKFQLSKENRLIWQQGAPSEAESQPEAPEQTPKDPSSKLDTEMQRTQDKVRTLAQHLEKSNNPKLQQIKERLQKTNEKLADFIAKKDTMRSNAAMRALDKINIMLDAAVGKERIAIARSILEQSAEDFKYKNMANLVDIFMLLKSDNIPLRVGDIAVTRKGDRIIFKHKKDTYTFKLSFEGGKWEMYEVKDKDLIKMSSSMVVSRAPLSGIREVTTDFINRSDLKTKINYEPSVQKEAKPAPAQTEAKEQQEAATQQLLENFSLLHNNNIKIKDSPYLINYLNSIKAPTKTPIKILGEVEIDGAKHSTVALVSCAKYKGKLFYRISVVQGEEKDNYKSRTITVDYWPQKNDKVKFAGKDIIHKEFEKSIQAKDEAEKTQKENLKAINNFETAIRQLKNINDITLHETANSLCSFFGFVPPFKSDVLIDNMGNSFRLDFGKDDQGKPTLAIYIQKPENVGFYKAYEDKGDSKPTVFKAPKKLTEREALERVEIRLPAQETNEAKTFRNQLSERLDAHIKKLENRDNLKILQDSIIKALGGTREVYERASNIAVNFKQRLIELKKMADKPGTTIKELNKRIDSALALLPKDTDQAKPKTLYANYLKSPKNKSTDNQAIASNTKKTNRETT